MKKIEFDDLDSINGGAAIDSYNGVPLYDWTKFAITIAIGVQDDLESYLTIRYAPDGPVNTSVGGWSNGEQVRIHPYYTMNGKDSLWRWGYRNGFYGWINGKYLT